MQHIQADTPQEAIDLAIRYLSEDIEPPYTAKLEDGKLTVYDDGKLFEQYYDLKAG